jgi:GT2 family glycosyltransferase
MPVREDDQALEISVVIPCLNEAKTITVCVARAVEAIKAAGVKGEVVVSDNGSTDDSVRVATAAGDGRRCSGGELPRPRLRRGAAVRVRGCEGPIPPDGRCRWLV